MGDEGLEEQQETIGKADDSQVGGAPGGATGKNDSIQESLAR
jgi:hypothetical protein